jgi:hypothetical protein
MANPISKNDLIDKLNNVDKELAKQALIKIFMHYLNPAFGALPKREIEIIMFQVLQDLEIFDSNPDLYSLLSSLRTTRSRARTLLYESNLRKGIDLDEALLEILKNPILLKDNDKVCLEVDNPLLIDHLKHELKDLNHITDGSFSADIVKLTPEAYKKLLNAKFGKIPAKQLRKALIECGAETEVTVQSLITGVLKNAGKKIASDAGDKAGELIGDFLGKILSGGTEYAKQLIHTNTLNNDETLEI